MRIDQLLGGRYRIIGLLGSGGMASVWRAQDSVLNRVVAVKVLTSRYSSDPAALQRIRGEAQVAASLSHPHVTSVYDYGEAITEDGVPVPYVVMEFLPGQTLFERLSAGPIPHRTGLRVCAEVAAALAAAHAQGLVHRDVKPSNVMLTASGAKVLDFGIATVAGRAELEEDGQLLGTPAYLAPERLTGRAVLPASDVYALGLLIHRVLTGRLPWTAETTTQMLTAHVYYQPAPLPPIDGVPSEINELTTACLAKHPDDRPEAAHVAAVLAAAAGTASSEEHELVRTGAPGAAGQPADQRTDPAAHVAGPGSSRRSDSARRLGLVVGLLAVASAASAATFWRAQPETVDRAPTVTQAGPLAEPTSTPPMPPTSPAITAATSARLQPPRAASATTARPSTAAPVPQPSASPTTLSATVAPAGTAITARGGVIRVECTGATARVLNVEPAAGYTVKDLDPGPASEVQVVLTSADNESEIKVKCRPDGPHPQIKESRQ